MKKLFIVLAVLFLAGGLFAQSLEDNEFYRRARELAGQSQTAMDAGDYEAAAQYAIESREYAERSRLYIAQALEAFRNRTPLAALAAEYEVKLSPANRDCLWKIAGYDFVYGNSFEWNRLYQFNRDGFRDPGNPNLIYPGQILKIPSISGESRSGRR
jgi:nucleoid-associated protein YgaU